MGHRIKYSKLLGALRWARERTDFEAMIYNAEVCLSTEKPTIGKIPQHLDHYEGPSINDVTHIFGLFGPPPPPLVMHSRNLSVLFVTFWQPPPPSPA